jgi:hypothetical protein
MFSFLTFLIFFLFSVNEHFYFSVKKPTERFACKQLSCLYTSNLPTRESICGLTHILNPRKNHDASDNNAADARDDPGNSR